MLGSTLKSEDHQCRMENFYAPIFPTNGALELCSETVAVKRIVDREQCFPVTRTVCSGSWSPTSPVSSNTDQSIRSKDSVTCL